MFILVRPPCFNKGLTFDGTLNEPLDQTELSTDRPTSQVKPEETTKGGQIIFVFSLSLSLITRSSNINCTFSHIKLKVITVDLF